MNTLSHSRAQDQAQPALDIAALAGSARWQQLSPAIRRRFAAAHQPVSYQGQMQLRSSARGRVFAWLAGWLGSPLAGGRAEAVPTTVHVRGDGQGGVIWERQLGLPEQPGFQRVRSTKRLGRHGGLEECTDGGLAMALQVCVEDGALVFYSQHYFLQCGRWRITVPRWMTPGTCRVEHRDEEPGQFRFTLDMVHPLWGHTFHQTGIFQDPEESTP